MLSTDDLDLHAVDDLVQEIGNTPEALIPLLQAIQHHYRYLPEAALRRICEITDITPAAVAGVSTFYAQFVHQPIGRHLISMCHGTACHVKGSRQVHDALMRYLHLDAEEGTDADGIFTLRKVACLGCCTLAPVMQIDGVTYGHLTPDSVRAAMEDFLTLESRGLVARQGEHTAESAGGLAEIRLGVGSCCVAGGSLEVRDALEQAIREYDAPVVVKPVGCIGMCHQTPLVEVIPAGAAAVRYAKVEPADAVKIIARHFKPRGIVRKMKAALNASFNNLLTDEARASATRYALEVRDPAVCAFLDQQLHFATEQSGELDPLNLDEYLAHEGFSALRRCLNELQPEEIIAEITNARLRGRGGAGFPTGRKWAAVRAATSELKYIVCNGDEGDPGAVMDRMLLESYPFRILEGMAIAAVAVGAREGILYIRAEYPLAVQRMREAIALCEARGLLGEHICGTEISLHCRIMEGAGAFVCGEETALLASLEGRRGMPRLRPPFPAERGLWGKPTNINNVETYALVPWIMRHGAARFAEIGTEGGAGTKVFSLTGKITRGGLIEVPMGISIRQIVETIGGGVPGGRHFKAVQIGGPSGGCIPAALADLPIDYEALQQAGAITGSGGLVVIDDEDCMVDIARYFLEFTQRESCGKCTLCRVGTRRMLDMLDRLCTGEGKAGDLEKLEELALAVKRGSLCGLGQTAPNPILSTLRYFREEYQAHLQGHCPAGKCKALIVYRVNAGCIGCTKCAQACPADAIPLTPYSRHVINDEKCTRCGICRKLCPVKAIEVV